MIRFVNQDCLQKHFSGDLVDVKTVKDDIHSDNRKIKYHYGIDNINWNYCCS